MFDEICNNRAMTWGDCVSRFVGRIPFKLKKYPQSFIWFWQVPGQPRQQRKIGMIVVIRYENSQRSDRKSDYVTPIIIKHGRPSTVAVQHMFEDIYWELPIYSNTG